MGVLEQAQQRPSEKDMAEEVHLDSRLETVGRQFLGVHQRPCIVHQDVDCFEALLQCCDEGSHRAERRKVDDHHLGTNESEQIVKMDGRDGSTSGSLPVASSSRLAAWRPFSALRTASTT